MTFHHICIQTKNYSQSLEFYTRILNMSIIEETPDFHGRDYNTWLKGDGFMIELQTPKKGELMQVYNAHAEGISHFCLYTDNLEDALQKIQQKGHHSFKEKNGKIIYQVNKGQLFKIIAPEGTIIEIRDQQESS